MSTIRPQVLCIRQGHRLLLRVAGTVGWALATVALVTLAYELNAYSETGAYRAIPFGELWFNVHVTSLNLIQAVVQRHLYPFLWHPIITAVLHWPAWSLLGAPAAILVAIAPSRRG